MSVSVLPASSALGGLGAFNTAMQNGASKAFDELSVAEIKEKAKSVVQSTTRGASPITLIKTARTQIAQARTFDAHGELKSAYSAYIKAASLVQAFMESAEFKQEALPGKKGVLWKEYQEYMVNEGRDIAQQLGVLESKLKDIERSTSHANADESTDNVPSLASGGSIADRLRALKSAGMAVDPVGKRLSRELPKPPSTPPLSPARGNAHNFVPSISSTIAPSPPVSNTPSLAPIQTASSNLSSHASANVSPQAKPEFVPPSAFGPPSPKPSPPFAHDAFNLAEFSQAFPSISELEESATFRIPSSSAPQIDVLPSPSVAAQNYPALSHNDTGSSNGYRAPNANGPPKLDTSLTNVSSVSPSGSPAPTGRHRSPTTPSIPRKPSNLSLHSPSPSLPSKPFSPPNALSMASMQSSTIASDTHTIPAGSSMTAPDRSTLPVANAVTPRQLHEYLENPALRVLLIDIRTRPEFERKAIRHPGDAVVCIEPEVLTHSTVTDESIENSFSSSPSIEHTLFLNRDKFDLLVMYDNNSSTFAPPFENLGRAIYEKTFRKFLKRMPVLLVGGIEAWQREFGEAGLVRSLPKEGEASHGKRHQHHAEHRREGAITRETHPDPTPSGPTTFSQTANGQAPSFDQAPGHGTEPTEPFGYTKPLEPARPLDSTRSPDHSTPATFSVHQGMVNIAAGPSHSISPPVPASTAGLSRKPAISRPQYTQAPNGVASSGVYAPSPQSWSSASGSIQYPTFNKPFVAGTPRSMSPTVSGSAFNSSNMHAGIVSPPPQASINPSPLSRRRSDYVDQSSEALSSLSIRPPIEYPELSHHSIPRPPPVAASSTLERQDNRPRMVAQPSPLPASLSGPQPPTIKSNYPVHYWPDLPIATSGLKNMGNTCYMNATIQCLNATIPFTRFFTEGRWQNAVNMVNPIGTKGQLAQAFASILLDMRKGDQAYLTPIHFRRSITTHASQFEGTEQHDCQEFLSFLLGGLHEDLNRVLKKPNYTPTPEREAELERLPQQIASEQEWIIYRMRDDSPIVDFFQGQFRNRLECLTCRQTSTTYNAFMYLTLPIPMKSSKVDLYKCLDAFVEQEIMEKTDAWNCPHCKTLRRATKRLSISRLPPVLLIHLNRFSSKGKLTDKIESLVDFPRRGLDLTNYMPHPLPPGVNREVSGAQQLTMDDPRVQSPPYKYDLYGVTNHYGSLTGGHYTAFLANRGGWLYCDDSRIVPADPKDVVSKAAYVLYYKRVRN